MHCKVHEVLEDGEAFVSHHPTPEALRLVEERMMARSQGA